MASRDHNTKEHLQTMEGSVERVTFHSEETGFSVLRVKVRGHRELVTVIGNLPHVVAGEWIRGRGEWVMNREHGQQFKTEDLRTMPPDSIEGIEKFLGSGLIKGIGPVYARKLVEKFGKEIFDIIDRHSSRLEEIEGIGKVRRLLIKEGWNEARTTRAIMSFLLAHGASAARAFRIYKTYGENAIQRVREDPYCLARDIRGIGFKTADAIAEKLGIEKTSELRARAGVEYVLREYTGSGHCACPPDELVEKAESILEIDDAIIRSAVDHGITERRLILDRKGGDDLLYLTSLYEAEVALASDLSWLSRGTHPCPPIDIDKAITWVEEKVRLKLEEHQREAMARAVESKVMVITGGPGVGKTTLVNAIIRVLSAKNMEMVLCAPTGRAAKRIAETSGRDAKTIHRLLVFDPATGNFKHNRRHPLQGDVFIVDEASMIDLPLASQLVQAIPAHAALILVGDVDQLPSVGPGMVLRDIIESDRFPVCRLTHIFRQAAESSIVTAAHAINDGHLPEKPGEGARQDFVFIPAEDPDEAADRIVGLVRKGIPGKTGLDPMRDIQVISPMQRGAIGARNLNLMLQQALNPRGEHVERFGYQYRVGDKVMQMENDYDKDVYNGDAGRITHLDPDGSEVTVNFGGRDISYSFQELDELAPSYAITIHKSQGSEYPCVVIPCHTQHFVMLRRNLLYTAVTRGKQLVVVVGTVKAMGIAVGRHEARNRYGALRERLADPSALENNELPADKVDQ